MKKEKVRKSKEKNGGEIRMKKKNERKKERESGGEQMRKEGE